MACRLSIRRGRVAGLRGIGSIRVVENGLLSRFLRVVPQPIPTRRRAGYTRHRRFLEFSALGSRLVGERPGGSWQQALHSLVVLVFLAAGCYPGVRATRTSPPSAAVPEFDAYGGLLSVEATATDRFRVEPIDGVWWFITPDGHGLWSACIDHVTPDGDYAPAEGTSPDRDAVIAKYGTEEAWVDAAVDRMADWRFNTLGET